jgi:ATP-binding cassette, subfamily B, bacterial
VVYQVGRGVLSVGQYAAFVALVQQFQTLLWVLLWDTALIDNDLRYIRDFFRYLDLPEEKPGASRLPESGVKQGIVFERVRFAYPGSDRWVLDGIDLQIRPGERIALVGENGAGKTTLVKLIARFYEPSEGTITLDGADIRRFDLASWRDNLAAGFQDFARLEVLARETVGVGDLPNLDALPVVERALDRAHAADVVATLPNGLETPLGRTWSNGSELSGGQWQKLALGRTMMRDRPLILLLDEPTAALDAHAEHVLFERYAASAREAAETTGAITLLVSHRFSTVRMADLIVVLDGARLVEVGTHDELMAKSGQYAELYGIQAAAYR